jgi:hypothetical protein
MLKPRHPPLKVVIQMNLISITEVVEKKKVKRPKTQSHAERDLEIRIGHSEEFPTFKVKV